MRKRLRTALYFLLIPLLIHCLWRFGYAFENAASGSALDNAAAVNTVDGEAVPANVEKKDLFNRQLDRGVKNTEPYSYVLDKRAGKNPSEAKQLLAEAVRHSPDTPAFYFRLAAGSFPDIFKGTTYTLEGIKAYKRNLWWLLSLTGLLYLSLLASAIASITVFTLISFLKALPLIKHDIEEDWRKLLMPLLLIPLSLLGPLFFGASLLFLAGLYLKGANKAPVYVALLLLIASPLLLRLTNILLSASTPELRAIVSVNEQRGNTPAVQALAGHKDFASRFSYALAMKREGRLEEAIAEYQDIIKADNDTRLYTNLGNAYAAIGNAALAKESYQKSVELRPSATAFYNLSQIYRDTLEFDKGDNYFAKARELDREAVSKFMAIAARTPSRFVIDETLSQRELRTLALKNPAEAFFPPSARGDVLMSAAASALCILFLISAGPMRQRARRCSRCNEIFCKKCAEGRPHKEDICPKCYISIIKPAEEAPKERVAKLLRIHEKKSSSRSIIRLLSFTLPGISQMYAGRALGGLIYLWLFLFMAAAAALNPLIGTGLGTYSHVWLNPPLIAGACLLYLASFLSIRRRLQKGWL
ncbi:MAG: hypothetical protein Q8J64_03560 [Thermodesulfovibrionales bacterium]|nr:hypothetical protein [Thermodesulfovibrionales bacterium]